jgi:imidazolonepropionase-like amidohydrolase
MSPTRFRWPLGAGFILTLGSAASGYGQPGTWALTNVRIQTVTQGVIEKGTIVIRNGLIQAVGASVPIPPDARTLDLAGRTVSPGLIDLSSSIAPGPTPTPTSGTPPQGAAATAAAPLGRPAGFDPARAVADELRPSSADLKAARDAGITAVLISAARGGIRGQSALVPTRDSLDRSAVIRAPVAVHFGFQGVQGSYPATLLGVIAYQRQTLYDARRYGLIADRYRVNPRGLERPQFDPGLEALVPVVRGATPAFFEATKENEIRRAVNLAREFSLNLTVVGATEGWRALDALKGRAAVVSVNFPRPTETTGWAYRLAQRDGPDSAQADSAARAPIEGNAAALAQAGVTVALGSGGVRPADFLAQVRKVIKAGLPEPVALEAVTIRPAELAGMGAALGSIETGKIANLVITEKGDLLADSARIRAVFIDGIRYEVAEVPTARAGAGTGSGAAAQIGGSWAMRVNSPQGPLDVTMTIEQTGADFSGSMASMMGTTAVDDGRVSGRSITWTSVIQLGGQSVTLSYRGEVDGNRMTGSATLGSFGTATFTAERRP